jgi:hypothetical protein
VPALFPNSIIFTYYDTVSSSNPKDESPMAGLDKSSPYKELRDKIKISKEFLLIKNARSEAALVSRPPRNCSENRATIGRKLMTAPGNSTFAFIYFL